MRERRERGCGRMREKGRETEGEIEREDAGE